MYIYVWMEYYWWCWLIAIEWEWMNWLRGKDNFCLQILYISSHYCLVGGFMIKTPFLDGV